MTFAGAVRTCLRRYATFSGRASRSEYWWFILFTILGSFLMDLVDSLVFGVPVLASDTMPNEGPLSVLFGLAVLVPSLSAGWRRMHDTGRSGLYLFYPAIVMLGIVAFVGVLAGFGPLLQGDFGALVGGGGAVILTLALIVLFISPLLVLWWLTRPSEDGPNPYGPNPHEVSS